MTDPFNPRHAASAFAFLREVLLFAFCLSVFVTLVFLVGA